MDLLLLLQNVHRLSGKQLRGLCRERGIDTSGLVEKQDFRRAILADTLRSVSNRELRSLRDTQGITASLVNKQEIINRLVASLDTVQEAKKSGGGQSRASQPVATRGSKQRVGTPASQRQSTSASKWSVADPPSKRHGAGKAVDWHTTSAHAAPTAAAAAAAAADRRKGSPPVRRRHSDPGKGVAATKRTPSIKPVVSPTGKATQSPFAVKLQSYPSVKGQLPSGRKLRAFSQPKASKKQGLRPRPSNSASGGGATTGGMKHSPTGMICAKCSQRIRKRDGHVKMEPAASTSTKNGNRTSLKKSVFFYHRGCFQCETCDKPEARGATSLELSAMRVTDNGEVFCRPHFLEHSAEVGNLSVCLRCLGPIDPYEGYVTMQGDAGGAAKVGGRTKSEAQQHRWHSACFTCADCGSVDNPKTTLSSAGARIAARSNATKQGLLLGKGKAWEHTLFCKKHFQQRFSPKCARCRRILRKYFLVPAKYSPLTSSTRQLLPLDDKKEKICPTCHAGLLACFACHRRYSPEHVVDMADGRVTCVECKATAVHSETELSAIMERVIAFFTAEGFQSLQREDFQNLKLQIVDRPRMAQLRKGYSRACHGVTITERRTVTKTTQAPGQPAQRTVEVSVRVRCIAVLSGLPRAQCGGVLAHELGHAFFSLWKFPQGLAAQVVEGTCELWAHLYLTNTLRMIRQQQRLAHETAAGDGRTVAAEAANETINELESAAREVELRLHHMATNSVDIYREGYKQALESFNVFGRNLLEFLRFVRKHKHFPSKRSQLPRHLKEY